MAVKYCLFNLGLYNINSKLINTKLEFRNHDKKKRERLKEQLILGFKMACRENVCVFKLLLVFI